MGEHALVFTDVEGSTELVQRLGDARAAEVWNAHDRAARELLRRHGGREIDRADGFFLLFDRADAAARFALGYHAAIAGIGLAARVGLHVGTVTLRRTPDADVAQGAKPLEVEGLAKPLAARVMALACGGQTLVSGAARAAIGAALDALDVRFASQGFYRMKGVDAPVEVHAFGPSRSATDAPPADTPKAYRVVRSADLWLPVREVRHNLVAERDAFVGREADLRALVERLDGGERLVTLSGPGGTGKTRLARRYGRAWLGDWPGGVYFCDLSEATSLDGVHHAVAGALEVPLAAGDPAVQLGHAIAGRGRCLLILDNFEQLTAHAPATVGRWLDRAGDAAFLVTSRERLQLAGETLLPLEPLPLHDEAIALFEVRARAQQPGFALDNGNRAAVAEVVRLVDGLPLAIELAAARVRLLSPAQVVERMGDRFRLLAGARGTAARQATLKATIDWSWDLLAPWEQAALAQCSVFEGGFTLAAAEAVLDLSAWPPAPLVMDAVQSLVDKSLLRRLAWPTSSDRHGSDEPYFGMYLSVHEYARARCRDAGAAAERAAQERHGRHFAGFGAAPAIEALFGHGGVTRRLALALALDNLVAACRRALARADAAVAVPVYRAAWEVLDLRGPFALGVALGDEVAALADMTEALRAATNVVRGRAGLRGGRAEAAETCFEQALDWARRGADRSLEGAVLGALGDLHRQRGRLDAAGAELEAAVALLRDEGHRSLEGSVVGNLGILRFLQSRYAETRLHFELAVTIAREVGNRRDEGIFVGMLGLVDQYEGRMDDARRRLDQALAIDREIGYRMAEATVINNLGLLHFDQGRIAVASQHYAEAIAIHRDLGNRRSEGLTLANLGEARAALGQLDAAERDHAAALAIAREQDDRRTEATVLRQLGQLHLQRGSVEAARSHLEQALVLARDAGDQRTEAEVCTSLGDLLGRENRLDEARAALRRGEALLRDAGSGVELARLLCVRGRTDLAAGDVEAAGAALAEAEAAAHAMRAGPESLLGREIDQLRHALT